MRSKVSFSVFSIILTACILVGVFIACIASMQEPAAFIILLCVYLVLLASALFLSPWYIKVSDRYLTMGYMLRSRKLRLDDIESVELFQPTMGAIRICGSGGFMGYWGIFREGDIGRYYAFYGKSSDCFLVRMKNGDKYVLGCDAPDAMVAYIDNEIRKD